MPNVGHFGSCFQLGGDNVERKSQRWNRGLLVHVAGLAVAFVLMFQFPDSAYAQSVNLAWDTSSDTTVVGYKVYRSEQSGSYTSPISGSSALTTVAFTDSTVQSGHTYYYVVTALNTSGVQSSYSNEVQAPIAAPASPTTNTAPTVNAGPDQTITLPSTPTVTANATDDGLPNGTLTYAWSVVSGGTGVTINSPDSATTSVSFTAAGTYTLRVTVSDSQLSASADVHVVVNTASLNLWVAKSGSVIKGAFTSISESTTDPRAARLRLFIDGQLVTTVVGSSLSYRWDLRNTSGSHVVTGMSFDSADTVLLSQSITVNER